MLGARISGDLLMANGKDESLRLNWPNLITAVSVMILIGTEVFAVAAGGAWALGGLYELGDTITNALYVIFGCFGLWAMWLVWLRVQAVESAWAPRHPSDR